MMELKMSAPVSMKFNFRGTFLDIFCQEVSEPDYLRIYIPEINYIVAIPFDRGKNDFRRYNTEFMLVEKFFDTSEMSVIWVESEQLYGAIHTTPFIPGSVMESVHVALDRVIPK
jgi:hypothetical protein